MVQFDWDAGNVLHIARHRVSPAEAEECILADPLDIGVEDVDAEERYAQIGKTRRGRILIVIVTMRNDMVRVVTAFDAPSGWRKYYLDKRAKSYD